MNFFQSHAAMPRCIVDNDPSKRGTRLYDTPVMRIDDALQSFPNCNIVITAPKYADEIRDDLRARCNAERIFSFEAEIYYQFIHDVTAYKRYLQDSWSRIERLYEELEDELSRETLLAFLKGRVSGDQTYFTDIMVGNQYYPEDIIAFGEDETMVELGSNDGQTLLEFLNKVGRKYKRIYCFEPDETCIAQLKEIERRESGEIHIIEKGAWDHEDTLWFHNDPEFGASGITQNEGKADCSVSVDSVDNQVKGPVTYMKMDIEGSELKALQGAEKTITQYKPKLAVCIYHNPQDFLEITEYLKRIVPEYRFYIRHHNWGATETVLYALT